MREAQSERLAHHISHFGRKRVAVIGDLILDEFVWGQVDRISPEAPVPVVRITRESRRLGGAANVGLNLRSLGAQVSLIGVIGHDGFGREFLKQVSDEGIEAEGIVTDESRNTTIKTRIIAHNQQVCRTDRESRLPLNSEMRDRIFKASRRAISQSDAVVISDYAKGVLDEETTRELIAFCREKKKFVAVDPKFDDFSRYRRASIVTPNIKEAERAWGKLIENESDLEAAGKEIIERYEISSLLITRGDRGMTLFQAQEEVTHIPTVAREVYDVTGAGDTVIATLALSVATGSTLLEAAHIANFAAGIVVGKLGTATAKPEELTQELRI